MSIINFDNVNLLLVEDDADFKIALTKKLAQRKFIVTAVDCAEEALEQLNKRTFDIIVSDIKLTGMDGMQFLEKINKIDESPPVILITGYANLESARKAISLNAFDYIEKPLPDIDELIISISKALQYHSLEIENNRLIESLQYLKEYYENIVSSVPDAIVTLTTEFTIESGNREFFERFGEKNDVIAKNLKDLFGEQIYEKVVLLKNSVGLKNNSLRFEYMIADKSGNFFPADITLKLAIIGKKDSILMVISDITELKNAEKEKKDIEIRFLQMQKQEALGNMASGIAHEFNNILSIILGHVQLSITEDSVFEIKQSLKEIEKATRRGSELVKNLSTFAIPKAPLFRTQDITESIEEVLQIHLKHLQLQNISIEREFNNPPEISFDRGQIEQVFFNLIINAAHAIKPMGKGTIKITIKELEKELEISVSDTGIGIDQAIKEKIFDPFFTTKGARAKNAMDISGTGLGLAVSEGIIKRHSGKISVISEINKGTVFTFMLPKTQEREIAFISKVKNIPETNMEKIKELRILLVDDEDDMVNLLNLIFKKAGFKYFLIKNNGVDALKIIPEFNPDIIFLDMLMPEMDGSSIYREIKSIYRELPVVFMSGKLDLDRNKFIENGAFDLIQKPFNINELYYILSRV